MTNNFEEAKKEARFLELPSDYAEAVLTWICAGRPRRSDSEVNAILERFCKPCEHFDRRFGLFGYCKSCGCNVNGSSVGLLNALRMATKGCPEGKFPSEEL